MLLCFSHHLILAQSVPPIPVTNPSFCGLNITIPDNSCPNGGVWIEVDVTTAPGTELGTDVFLKELKVIFDHEWVRDLDFYLVS